MIRLSSIACFLVVFALPLSLLIAALSGCGDESFPPISNSAAWSDCGKLVAIEAIPNRNTYACNSNVKAEGASIMVDGFARGAVGGKVLASRDGKWVAIQMPQDVSQYYVYRTR